MQSRSDRAQQLFEGLVPHGTVGSVLELLQSAEENDLSEELSLFRSNAEVAEKLGVIAKKDINDLSTVECEKLESVIHRYLRPAIAVTDGKLGKVPWPWNSILTGEKLTKLEQSFPSIGRIELNRRTGLEIIGTAYIVGDGMLMTNRHVVEVFKAFRGQKVALEFQQCLGIDFIGETDSKSTARFSIREIVYVHHTWDLAILRCEIPKNAIKPLVLAGELRSLERNVAAIGFPVFDDRVPPQIQNEIFSIYGVKRVLPGKLTGRASNPVQGELSSLLHDCSTLGGNSGSALFDLESGLVVGLHFAGRYLESNFAVPLFELSNEQELKSLGVCFAPEESGSPENVLASKTPPDTGSSKVSIALTKQTIISKQPTNALIVSAGMMTERESSHMGDAEGKKKKPSLKTIFFKFADTVFARMKRACYPGIHNSEFQEAVWYIEAKFADGLKSGSGVVVRRTKDEHQRNLLITCRHVVTDDHGDISGDIRCWPHGSGYNPETMDLRRIWCASSTISQTKADDGEHVSDGNLDWIAIVVSGTGRSFDAMPHKRLKRSPHSIKNLRLLGFPSGSSTMNENVVRASISRDFGLSEIDSKPGVLAFTGPWSTTGGNSGGPLLNTKNEVIAIHRSKMGEVQQYAVKASVIDEALQELKWMPVNYVNRNWDLWLYRLLFILIPLCVAFSFWLCARPAEITISAVERKPLAKRIDHESSQFQVVNPPNDATARINHGILKYQSRSFESISPNDDPLRPFIRNEQIWFSNSWIGPIRTPLSHVNVRVHQHKECKTLHEWRTWLEHVKYDDLIVDPWNRPAISITILAGELSDVDRITQKDKAIEVELPSKNTLPAMRMLFLDQDRPPILTFYEFRKDFPGVEFWFPLMFLTPDSSLERDNLRLQFIPASRLLNDSPTDELN